MRDALVTAIITGQRQLQRAYASNGDNPLMGTNLTMSQLKILLVLAQQGPAGGQELTRELGVSLATMTGIVDRLVSQRLVTRREDPTDRRVRLIELTGAGRDLVDAIVTAGMERQRQLLATLSDDELAVVAHATDLMSRAMCSVNGGRR
jgi:DNA-binding MarR family transcriptional regulator